MRYRLIAVDVNGDDTIRAAVISGRDTRYETTVSIFVVNRLCDEAVSLQLTVSFDEHYATSNAPTGSMDFVRDEPALHDDSIVVNPCTSYSSGSNRGPYRTGSCWSPPKNATVASNRSA